MVDLAIYLNLFEFLFWIRWKLRGDAMMWCFPFYGSLNGDHDIIKGVFL